MITLEKVSKTTEALAREFNEKIVNDLALKIKSHCCMLGIAVPCVKVFSEYNEFKFVTLDDFVLSLESHNISMAEIEQLHIAERYYLNKVVAIKAQTQVSYEAYIEAETAKYISRHTTEFLNKK